MFGILPQKLAGLALQVWPRPELGADVLAAYQLKQDALSIYLLNSRSSTTSEAVAEIHGDALLGDVQALKPV